MRKTIAIIMMAILATSLFASGAAETTASSTPTQGIIVFAAASLTETMTELGQRYEEANPGTEVVFNFDSSGTLKTQIQEGAPCDIFISAAPLQMDQLQDLGLVDTSTRLDMLENKVTLATAPGNPAGIGGFDDLVSRLGTGSVFLAIGNSDVPVGQYTQKIFDYYGINETAIASCLTYGSNVKEVTTQVAEESVDCGIIYATDAFSAGLEVIDEATPEMCGQVIYPAAILLGSPNRDAAEGFFEYIKTDEAMEVFASVGFSKAF